MSSRGRQKRIDVDVVRKESNDDGFDKGDILVTVEQEKEQMNRISITKRLRGEVLKTRTNQLTFAEMQTPINTLHPRMTSVSNGKPIPLSLSSEDFSAPSPQPRSSSVHRNMWGFSQITRNDPIPLLDNFASTGPLHSPPAIFTKSRHSFPDGSSLRRVDQSLGRSTFFSNVKSPDLDDSGARHLLYPDEQIEHDHKSTSEGYPHSKSPYFKTETIAQITLHQVFIGTETILADEMSLRFDLHNCLPSELITIITSTAMEIPLNLSSLRCNRIQVSLKASPYFIEIEFIQQNALPVQLMSMCVPGTALGTGWARFSFAKPDRSESTKIYPDVLMAVDKCLRSVFGDKVSEVLAGDMHYTADRWRPYANPNNYDDASFSANLSIMRRERKEAKSRTPPLQTSSSTCSSVATRKSTRLICYSNRKRQSMNGDEIQTDSSRFVSLHHIDSPNAKLLFVYPEDDPHGILVTTNELARLEPGIYLNDTLVELDMRWIFEDIKPSLRQRSFYFSSFFYRKLTANNHQRVSFIGGSQSQETRNALAHRQVRKWTQNINIFERDFLFIPICEHLHWYLIIVAFPKAMLTGKKINKEGEEKGRTMDEQPSSGVVSSDVFETDNFSNFIPPLLEEELSGDEVPSDAQSVTRINSLSTHFPTSDTELGGPNKIESSLDRLRGTVSFLNDSRTPSLVFDSGVGKDAVTDLVSTSQPSQGGGSSSVIFDDDRCKESVQQIPNSSTDQKCCIICYDSLGGSRSKQVVFNNIKHYLVAEAADKLGEEADMKRSHGVSLKGPIQTNSTDCGLFMLQSIERFLSEDAPDAWVKSFTKTNDHPKWFSPSEAIIRRQALKERVVRTAEQFSIKTHTVSPTMHITPVEDDDDLIILSGPPTPTL